MIIQHYKGKIYAESNDSFYITHKNTLAMDNKDYLNAIYRAACFKGLCHSVKDFADLLESNRSSVSSALNGNEKYLNPTFMKKVQRFAADNGLDNPVVEDTSEVVRLIPYEARGGTIGDFVDGVHEYDCEKIISPVKGADFAMEVTGDSMSPEYPSGSRVLIKKVDESAFIAWNEVYVLDTPNGAVIKRVRKTDNPELVECVSINPAYQAYTIPKKFIRGWYRVLLVMALK